MSNPDTPPVLGVRPVDSTETALPLDELRALIEAADLPSPIEMDYRYDPEAECVIGVMAAGGGVEARIHTEETARLIEAALNHLPALLTALDEARAELVRTTGQRDTWHQMWGEREEEVAGLREQLAAARRDAEQARAELRDAKLTIAARDAALDASAETHHIARQIVAATLGATPAATPQATDVGTEFVAQTDNPDPGLAEWERALDAATPQATVTLPALPSCTRGCPGVARDHPQACPLDVAEPAPADGGEVAP